MLLEAVGCEEVVAGDAGFASVVVSDNLAAADELAAALYRAKGHGLRADGEHNGGAVLEESALAALLEDEVDPQ